MKKRRLYQMPRLLILWTAILALLIPVITPEAAHAAEGTTYYISSSEGNDNNDGLSASKPWKSLEKVIAAAKHPGDTFLFKAGDVWNGSLKMKNISGSPDAPIVFDKYGSTDPDIRPIINGNGTTTTEKYSIYTYYNGVTDKTQSATVDITDGSYIEINNFELTNYNESVVSQRAGIAFKTTATNQAEWTANPHKGITVKNNYVHDVNGNPKGHKMGSGGILFFGNISDVLVENNKIVNVDIEGIRNAGLYREGDTNANFPRVLTNVQFRNNYIEKVQGDGMVMSNIGAHGRMEYNTIVEHSFKNVGNVNYAGLWVIGVKDTVIQFNEVYGGKYGYNDGQAFDVDMFCEGTLYQYNYSHDNRGGFILFMGGSTNSLVRYNVSVNDGNGAYILHYLPTTANDSPLIHNNTFFTDSHISTRIFSETNNKYAKIYNNAFMARGSLTMGGSSFSGGDIKNNAFYPGTSIKNQSYSGITFADNMFLSPKFARPGEEPKNIITGLDTFNASALDGYKLMADSPLIDAGADVTNMTPSVWEPASRDFFDNKITGPVDIGAHEYSNDQPADINPEVLPTSITLDRTELSLNLDNIGTYLNAVVLPENAWVKEIQWTSSNPSVASVDNSGNIVAVSEGTAVITAASVANPAVKAVSTVTVESMAGLYYPTDDSFIRGGSYASDNYGSDPQLSIKSDSAAYTRHAYIKFNIGDTDREDIESAVLRMYARSVNTTPERTISVYATGDNWSESTLTWNNAPARTTFITSAVVTAADEWYEFDLTNYLKSLDKSIVSLILMNDGPAGSTNDMSFTSKEGGAMKPQLIISGKEKPSERLDRYLVASDDAYLSDDKKSAQLRIDGQLESGSIVNDPAYYKVNYQTDHPNAVVDPVTGKLVFNGDLAGVKQITVTAEVQEYTDLIYSESFESGLGEFVREQNPPTDGTGPILSRDVAYHGKFGVKYDRPPAVEKVFGPNQHGVVTMMLYDDGTKNGTTRVVAHVGNDRTKLMAGLGVFFDGGKVGNLDNYSVRASSSSTAWEDTGIPRTVGWHELKWDYTSGTDLKMYLDGQLVKTTTAISSFDRISLAFIWDSAAGRKFGFDNIKYAATDAKTTYQAEPLKVAVAGAATLASSLSAPVSVQAGDTFTVRYGLSGVDQPYYAQDLTINYDPELFEFIDAVSVTEEVGIVDFKQTDGKVRLIIASKGEQHGVAQDGELVAVTFKAKAVEAAKSGMISTVDVTLGVGDLAGTEVQADSASVSVEVRTGAPAVPGDYNNDGKVSIGDLAMVAAHYGKDSKNSPDWEQVKKFDFNKDGVIDIVDLAEMAQLLIE